MQAAFQALMVERVKEWRQEIEIRGTYEYDGTSMKKKHEELRGYCLVAFSTFCCFFFFFFFFTDLYSNAVDESFTSYKASAITGSIVSADRRVLRDF